MSIMVTKINQNCAIKALRNICNSFMKVNFPMEWNVTTVIILCKSIWLDGDFRNLW